MSKRNPYRASKRAEVDRIEARRKSRCITVDELAPRAGMTARSYYRMLRSGFAFPRNLRALVHAIRSIEQDRKLEGELFPFEAIRERPR